MQTLTKNPEGLLKYFHVTPEDRLSKDIALYLNADPGTIQRKILKLDKEWDTDRTVELVAPLAFLAAVGLSALHSRRWLAVSALVAGTVLLRGVAKPLLWMPAFQRLGIRSSGEIEVERMALRSLRGDHEFYQSRSMR